MSRVPARPIASKLLRWYDAGHRDLPWRRTDDPYRIWVSEVMLQQTRAEAVIPYYERFLARFPTAEALASAREADVLACWSGLGYYSRARNLQRAARLMDGAFPRDYEAIRELPGIGDYTAAAIASIAFGLPYAVVDGNVLRVIARVIDDASDISAAGTRTRFRAVAQEWLDRRRPGVFNQALMELGATVCLPRTPRCEVCPLTQVCAARQLGRQSQLPVKLRRAEPVKIAADVVVVHRGGRILMWQRTAESRRLAGFWELPASDQLAGLRGATPMGTFLHTITHHHYEIAVQKGSVTRAAETMRWIPVTDLDSIPLSTTARKALRLAGILIRA